MVAIGTWNVENLFSAGEFAPTPEVFAAKVEGIATTIEAAGLDIVALQEVGDDNAFAALITRLGASWSGAASTAPDSRGIRVAVVSKLETTDIQHVVELAPGLTPPQTDDGGGTATRMGRGALRVRVATPAGDLDVLTCHLKSKLITYPGGRFSPRDEDERARFAAYALYRRAAEATTIRHYANAVLGGTGTTRRMVLLGDLNDEPQAATTQILQGPTGSEIGTGGEDIDDQGDGWRLLNLVPLLPPNSATRVFRGRGELIDHIFVSKALRAAVTGTSIVAAGPLPSITEIPTARSNTPVSDHAMVVAALNFH